MSNLIQVPNESFLLVKASKLRLYDDFLQIHDLNQVERYYKEQIENAIQKGVKDFYCQKYDPSFNEDESGICYEPERNPALMKTIDWWDNAVEEFEPGISRWGTKSEWLVFIGVIIQELIEIGFSKRNAWSAVVLDARELGDVRERQGVNLTFEPTGNKSPIPNLYDLINTYKILVDDVSRFRGRTYGKYSYCIAGGSSPGKSQWEYIYHNLAMVKERNFFHNEEIPCVAWIVKNVKPESDGGYEKMKVDMNQTKPQTETAKAEAKVGANMQESQNNTVMVEVETDANIAKTKLDAVMVKAETNMELTEYKGNRSSDSSFGMRTRSKQDDYVPFEGAKIIAKSNYEIASSIISSSKIITAGLLSISNELERKNKLDEYDKLIEQITECEDKLIDMGIFKEAYEQLELTGVSPIEMKESEIKFCALIFKKNIESAKSISANYLLSPLEYLRKMLYSKKVHEVRLSVRFKPKGNGREIIKEVEIPELGIQLPSVEYLNLTKDDYSFIINTHKYRFVTKTGSVYVSEKTLGASADEMLSSREVREYSDSSIKYVLLADVSSEDISFVLENIKEDLKQDNSIQTICEMGEMTAFLNNLNRDIVINNLRILREQLRNAIRSFKLQQLGLQQTDCARIEIS